MFKVSIIVPVFHVEKYIKRCISSLLSQTYSNIEIILIDDGGDDECPSICRKYAEEDKRVKYIRKDNEGQSYARKKGLEISSGDFIMYVDADDWLEANAVEIALNAIVKHNADIVLFGYKRVYEKNTFKSSIFSEDCVFIGEEVRKIHRMLVGAIGEELREVEKVDRIVTMWGKLYSRRVACSGVWVSEREVGSSEDAIYNLGAFSVCKKCVYINMFLYNYRKSNENATTRKYRSQLVTQWKRLYQYFETYIRENKLSKEYNVALQNRIALGMLGIGLNELSSDRSFFQKAAYLRKVLKYPKWERAFKELEFKYFPFKWKIFYALCKLKQTELLLTLLKIINKLKTVIAE